MANQLAIVSHMTCSSLARSPSSPIPVKNTTPAGGNYGRRRRRVGRVSTITQLNAATKEPEVGRRSGNYQPTVWDYDLLQSYTPLHDIHDEKQVKEIERLEDDVKSLFIRKMDPLVKLEFIDSIQRLGLECHFEMEIKTALDSLYHQDVEHPSWTDGDLYTTALKFRLFRQKGLAVSEDVFKNFKEEYGALEKALHEDVKALLSLYEASFLGYQDEAIIDEINVYSTIHLKNLTQRQVLLEYWARNVEHALDMPLHWRPNRLEAKWFIDIYEQEEHMNPSLLQLAKLDYNIIQSTYLREVQELIRWWMDMGLNKIEFSRDRILEHYLWSCPMIHEPQFQAFRIGETKFASFVSLVDDIYDVYGSMEELELITDIVDRWDISGVDKLSPSERTVLLAMFNTSNEIGYMCIKKHGFNAIPVISKAWGNLCKAYLKEAKWYREGYIPPLDQYMSNSVVSSSGPLLLTICYLLATEKITKEGLEYIQNLQPIVHSSSVVLRLTNDLGTSKYELARGDTKKAVECYMNEAEVGEEAAREHINELVNKDWKKMNKAMAGSYPFSEAILRGCQNLARISHHFYQNGDGHGVNPGDTTKEHLMNLLLLPAAIN